MSYLFVVRDAAVEDAADVYATKRKPLAWAFVS